VHVTVTGIRGGVDTLPHCMLQRCGGVYVRSSEHSSLAAEDETSVRWQAETAMDSPWGPLRAEESESSHTLRSYQPVPGLS